MPDGGRVTGVDRRNTNDRVVERDGKARLSRSGIGSDKGVPHSGVAPRRPTESHRVFGMAEPVSKHQPRPVLHPKDPAALLRRRTIRNLSADGIFEPPLLDLAYMTPSHGQNRTHLRPTTRESITMVDEGDTLPTFELPTDDGGTVSPASLKGNPAVLYFYPKDDTSGCTKESQAFTELKGEFDALGIPIVGIAPGTVASKQKFKTKRELDVILAADEDTAVVAAFGIWVEKSMYGKKYMGVERSTYLVDADGKVAKAWRKVKVPGHAEAVLEAAKELAG